MSFYININENEVAQSCPTLCDPVDCSPPGSSVHVILQARILEWVAISISKESSQPRDQTHISCISCILKRVLYQLSHLLLERLSTSESVCISHSCVQFFVTPWTVAGQAPLSLEFSRQEYWSGLQFLPPGDLPRPEIKPRSPALLVDFLQSEPQGIRRTS